MRGFFFLVLLASMICGACSADHAPEQDVDRALFVGNSLTYVGNLPAVFSAMARVNGHEVRSYMLAAPGATLSQRVADGSAGRALRACACNVMVLQERGGDLFGSFGDDALAQSRQSVVALARTGAAGKASVIVLGTHNAASVSHRLVTMEGEAAQAAGVPYVAVSERFWRLRGDFPSLEWLRPDGAHPGKALTLLDAVLLFKQVYGVYPVARAFTVQAPIYGDNSGLTAELRLADASPPNAGTPRTVSYPAAVIRELVAAIEHAEEEKPGSPAR